MTKYTPCTTKAVRELPHTGDRYETKTGTPGLRVAVGAHRGKSYRWYYAHPFKLNAAGKPLRCRLTLGDAMDITYGEAGDLLEEAKLRAAAGHDPEVAPQYSTARPDTFGELLDQFYEQRILTVRERPESVEQMIRASIKPHIGGVALGQITQDHLLVPSQRAVSKGHHAHAKNLYQTLKQCCGWAVARKKLDRNPLADLSLVDAGIPDTCKPRERVLSDDELTTLFDTMAGSRMCKVKQHMVELLLLTGLRTQELRLNEWSNVDLDTATMTVPLRLLKTRNKSKSMRDMRVPLSPRAVTVLRHLKRLTGRTGFIVGEVDPQTGEGRPMARDALRKALVRLNRRMGLAPFCPHDLRRTCRTRLADIGVAYEVAETYIGHALPAIVRTYQTGDLFDQRRVAANDLAAHYAQFTQPAKQSGKVVAIG